MAIPGGQLAKGGPAESWIALVNYIKEHEGLDIRPKGPVSSFRPRAAQEFFWAHQPPPAARPGTSNHGWGNAVDVFDDGSGRYWAAMRRHAPKFGWSWDEGQRVGEPWHFRYVGGGDRKLIAKWFNPSPLRHLMDHERKMVLVLARRRHKMVKEGESGHGPRWALARRLTLRSRDKLEKQMHQLSREAHRAGNWKARNRGLRRHILALALAGKI